MEIKNSSGPRADAWGTHFVIEKESALTELTEAYW